MNGHLKGLDDTVPWPEVWTLARMYAKAERAQQRAHEAALERDAVACAVDARLALERTAELIGVVVPAGPLPDAQVPLHLRR